MDKLPEKLLERFPILVDKEAMLELVGGGKGNSFTISGVQVDIKAPGGFITNCIEGTETAFIVK